MTQHHDQTMTVGDLMDRAHAAGVMPSELLTEAWLLHVASRREG